MSDQVLIERNVAVPLRDGTVTRANVYRPRVAMPVPAILVRTPYGKDVLSAQVWSIDPLRASERGYAVVFQDTRGRFESEGDFYPHRFEADDGYDSVEWVADQPWCNGAVGMSGLSYLGAVQWLAAIRRPPHLKAIVPIATGSEDATGMMAFRGGAFKLGFLLWWITTSIGPEAAARRAQALGAGETDARRVLEGADRLADLVGHLPLRDLPLLRDHPVADFYFDWMERAGEQCEAVQAHYHRLDVPALNVSGWYDYFLAGTLENYVRMRREAPTEAAREGQQLLIGPWDHILNSVSSEWDFGVSASAEAYDLAGHQLRYFDRHLDTSGSPVVDSATDLPRARIFVMGKNAWRDEDDWPLDRARPQRWFLHSDGDARSEGARLSPSPPGDEPPDSYLYDPRQPAPTVGGPVGLPGLSHGVNVGPRDQRAVEARADVLVYTSDVLDAPLEVTGPVRALLYASSSGLDTDFFVRLCDVHPDGPSRVLTEGVLRARYRDGDERPSLLEPGRVYAFDIDMIATSNVFMPGHRIRIHVTSSSFPYYDRNPNTGKPLGHDEPADLTPALQTLFHDADRASHVVLPVVAG